MRAQTAIRIALGAPRYRLLLQTLAESLLLSILGGLAGLLVAFAGTRTILVVFFRGSHYVPIGALPSLPVLGFCFSVVPRDRHGIRAGAGVDYGELGRGRSAARRGTLDEGPLVVAATLAGGVAGGAIRDAVDRRRPADPDVTQSGAPALRLRTAIADGGEE